MWFLKILKVLIVLICMNLSASELLENFSKGINPGLEEEYDGLPKYQNCRSLNDRLSIVSVFIGETPVILEAGAHEGEHTENFVQLWPKSIILAFEPNPRAMTLIKEKFKTVSQVKTFELALDASEGEKLFYLCQGPSKQGDEGASSLLPSSDYMKFHYQGDIITVNSVVLDRFCELNSISQIDFMWLDLEGKEFDALVGGINILKTTKVVYVETNFQEFRVGGIQYECLKELLEGLGFEMVAHWYLREWQGDAIFVRKDLL